MLMSEVDTTRARNVIHPSEIAKANWCPRATYYRLAGIPEVVTSHHSTMLSAFAEGHEIHHKWQGWLWRAGILEGDFECMACSKRWEDCSPPTCPHCGADRMFLAYREVPLSSPEYLIGGHADGIANNAVIEIKSIGPGTLRFEAPKFLEEHTHRVDGKDLVDLDGLWNDIRRPFPAHLRQGMIYAFCTGLEEIVYLYECKWNQRPKEFVVRYNERHIANILESCLEIKEALDGGRIPTCPNEDCADCERFKEGKTQRLRESQRAPGSRRIIPAGRAEKRDPEAAVQHRRVDRRRLDGASGRINSLGGLFERAASDLRD